MDTAAVFVMMMAGPMISSIVIAANAKKINAQWRARRARRAATSAAS